MAEGVNYVTITQYYQVGEETLLTLPTHILPSNCSQLSECSHSEEVTSASTVVNQAFGSWTGQRKGPYVWFNDRLNQEVMVCVHGLIHTKAVENLLCRRTQSKPSSAANKPTYEFRRSGNLRMLLTFRPVQYRQHILFPVQTNNSDQQVLVPRAVFISEYGRRVLPHLGIATYGGAGYAAFKVLPEALHVYVDNLELTSHHGIFKMLRQLDPKHTLSPNILSYFQQTSSSAEEESAEVLPQVPVAGLRQKASERTAKSSTRLTKPKRGNVKHGVKSKQQSTILTAFAKYQQQQEQREADEVNLPDNILENVWNFDSSQPTCSPVASEVKDTDCHCVSEDTSSCTELVQVQMRVEDNQLIPDTGSNQNKRAVKGTKRQRLTTAQSSRSTAGKNKKAKLCPSPRIKEAQNTNAEQNLSSFEQDYDDPFDELLASQSEVRSRPNARLRVAKRQQRRIVDSDEDQSDLETNPEQSQTTITEISSRSRDDKGAENDPKLSTTLGLRSTQPHNTKEVDIALSPVSANSSQICDFLMNDINSDDVFGISTPHFIPSPAESDDTDKDLASHLPQYEAFNVSRLSRSSSQPASHCSNCDKEIMSSLKRTKSYSDSGLEVNSKSKFEDITNTIGSPGGDDDPSPRKMSVGVSVKRSVVDLTQESVSEQPQCSDRVGKQKKSRPLPASGPEVFAGTKKVADLTRQQLTDWMRLNHPVLMNIFKRKQYSWRHEQFNTNPKKRAAMKWKYDSRRFTEDQVKLITDILLKIFCWRHMKYFNYVMSVLLPETLVRVIADVHGVSFEEGETLMFNFQGQAQVDLT